VPSQIGLAFPGHTTRYFVPSQIGLAFPGHTTRSLPIFVGAMTSATFDLPGDAILTGTLRASWRREFETDRTQRPSFLAAPGVAFPVQGAPATRDMLRTQVGLQLGLNRNLSLFSYFGGDFARASRTFSGSGGVRYAW